MSLQMTIYFTCECGEHVEGTVYVQDPDFSAEKNKDSYTESWQAVFCPTCEKEYEVRVTNSFFGAECMMEDGEIQVDFGMPYYPEDEAAELNWYIESKSHYEILQNHLKNVRTLLEVDVPVETLFSLWVMLHGHVISAIEGYLAGNFIHKVTSSENLIKKLVETDPEFSRRTFSLKEIFEKQSTLKITVATYLKNLIFHDLKRVKPMYNEVLGHDFGDITWLFKAVTVRHDCVHRAGFDKEGEAIDISKESVTELLEGVESLAESIQATVEKLDEPDDLPF